jgi:putative SOS response-associated peptidase YedK
MSQVGDEVARAAWTQLVFRRDLIPHYVDARPALQPIRARAKTISEMKMFRDTYRKRRCIVPISSFFRRTRRRSVRLSTDAP